MDSVGCVQPNLVTSQCKCHQRSETPESGPVTSTTELQTGIVSTRHNDNVNVTVNVGGTAHTLLMRRTEGLRQARPLLATTRGLGRGTTSTTSNAITILG
jgi:hypothetical protein